MIVAHHEPSALGVWILLSGPVGYALGRAALCALTRWFSRVSAAFSRANDGA